MYMCVCIYIYIYDVNLMTRIHFVVKISFLNYKFKFYFERTFISNLLIKLNFKNSMQSAMFIFADDLFVTHNIIVINFREHYDVH